MLEPDALALPPLDRRTGGLENEGEGCEHTQGLDRRTGGLEISYALA